MTDDPFNKMPGLADTLGEIKSAVGPDELPDAPPPEYPAGTYPLPWKLGQERGNGHVDILAANGAYVAHIYCWDEREYAVLYQKLITINTSRTHP